MITFSQKTAQEPKINSEEGSVPSEIRNLTPHQVGISMLARVELLSKTLFGSYGSEKKTIDQEPLRIKLSAPSVEPVFSRGEIIGRACQRNGVKTSDFQEFMKEFDDEVNKNILPLDRFTPLHKAIEMNTPQMMKVLLDLGADPNLMQNNLGMTPLKYALFYDDFDLVLILLRSKASVIFFKPDKVSLLEYAKENKNQPRIIALLEKAAAENDPQKCDTVLTESKQQITNIRRKLLFNQRNKRIAEQLEGSAIEYWMANSQKIDKSSQEMIHQSVKHAYPKISKEELIERFCQKKCCIIVGGTSKQPVGILLNEEIVCLCLTESLQMRSTISFYQLPHLVNATYLITLLITRYRDLEFPTEELEKMNREELFRLSQKIIEKIPFLKLQFQLLFYELFSGFESKPKEEQKLIIKHFFLHTQDVEGRGFFDQMIEELNLKKIEEHFHEIGKESPLESECVQLMIEALHLITKKTKEVGRGIHP